MGACTNASRPSNQEDSQEEMTNIPQEAKEHLTQAEMEIEKEHDKIDNLFDKLLDAQRKMTNAKEQVSKFGAGTPEYATAQQEMESSENVLQIILDDVNGQYAKIYGFLLTVSDSEGMIEAVKDKIKSHVAVVILEKYKQKALDEIDYKYMGESHRN